MDLLQHEGLIAPLLGGVLVPGDLFGVSLHRGPRGVEDRHPRGIDCGDLAVLDLNRVAGLGEKGWDRRGEEGLSLADPGDQRALLSRPDQPPRLIDVHRDEGVVAAQLGEGCAHGRGQIAFVVALDQVGDDLGVGLGAEGVALGLQLVPQRCVVLDDPVENDVDSVGAVTVGVSVLLGDPAVGGPARVGDSGRGRRGGDHNPALAVVLGNRGAQVREVADRADAVDPPVIDHRDASRVIAAVLELLQPGDQEVTAWASAHVSDDAAHEGRRVDARRFSPAPALQRRRVARKRRRPPRRWGPRP